MTQFEKRMSTQEIGKRFKDLINEFDCKQEVTAAYLGKCKTTISRYCSGTCPIPAEVIEKCARKWDIRKEYISGCSDCRTERELLESYSHAINDRDYLLIQMIRDLGYSLSFGESKCEKPNADMSILGDNDETVNLSGNKMDILDFQYMLDDITDYMLFVLDNPQKYINRREYTIATDDARTAQRFEKKNSDEQIAELRERFGEDAVFVLREM